MSGGGERSLARGEGFEGRLLSGGHHSSGAGEGDVGGVEGRLLRGGGGRDFLLAIS